jgi:hypothetical protein
MGLAGVKGQGQVHGQSPGGAFFVLHHLKSRILKKIKEGDRTAVYGDRKKPVGCFV